MKNSDMLSEGGERGRAGATCFPVCVCVCVCVCAEFNGLFPRTLAWLKALALKKKPPHKKKRAVIHKLPQSSIVNNTPLKGDTDGFNSQLLSG